jgi:hypothetical protein
MGESLLVSRAVHQHGTIYPEASRRVAVELYRRGGTTYAAAERKLGVGAGGAQLGCSKRSR